MWWWNGPHPVWGMGWIFPLIFLAFMVVCLFAISRLFRGGVGFCGGRRYNARTVTDIVATHNMVILIIWTKIDQISK